jgi:hypothetical protein
MNDDAPAPQLTTLGELKEPLDIVTGISQTPQGTSRPGSYHMRLGSVKPQSKSSINGDEPAAEPYWSMLLKAKPVEPVSIYPCIQAPANSQIDIRFQQKGNHSSCICRRIKGQTVSFDVLSP